jgi:uncharacterized protein (TIGR02246 family)
MLRVMVAFLLISAILPVAAQQDDRSAALEAFFSDLAAAAEAGDRPAYTSLFVPDAAMFLPHRPPLIGRAAIGDWFDSFRGLLKLRIASYEQQNIEIVGDVAMVRSRATGHYLNTGSGENLPLDQKYLDVLRYEDGQWRMVYHVANSNTFHPGIWESDWESQ